MVFSDDWEESGLYRDPNKKTTTHPVAVVATGTLSNYQFSVAVQGVSENKQMLERSATVWHALNQFIFI